jgi:hypothetical protein
MQLRIDLRGSRVLRKALSDIFKQLGLDPPQDVHFLPRHESALTQVSELESPPFVYPGCTGVCRI